MNPLKLLAVCAILASPAVAQNGAPSAFVVRLGNDTIAVERFERTADSIRGELVAFTPSTRVIRYAMQLTRAGTVVSGEYRVHPGAGGADGAPSLVAEFMRHDTVMTVISRRAQRTDTLRVIVPPGTVPSMTPSIVPYEQMVMQAFRQGGDSIGIALYSLGARGATPNHVVRRTADSVGVEYFGADHYLALGADGRVLGLNGARTTNKMMVDRVETPVDIGAIAAARMIHERAAGAAGALSTRDTARATVAGVELMVDYGRPSARGRQILGQVVPLGEVWRTGANQATQFTTARALQAGTTTIPAGTYTLWTLPTEEGVTLIINRQTGQWGTIYDSALDLARVPMEVTQAAVPVERFTIEIEPGSTGGALVMQWQTFVWRLPFTVR